MNGRYCEAHTVESKGGTVQVKVSSANAYFICFVVVPVTVAGEIAVPGGGKTGRG